MRAGGSCCQGDLGEGGGDSGGQGQGCQRLPLLERCGSGPWQRVTWWQLQQLCVQLVEGV